MTYNLAVYFLTSFMYLF